MSKQFEVGRSYFGRFACNYDSKHFMRVVRRTAKSIWIDDNRGAGRRLAIHDGGDYEYVLPLGNYSMAMVIGAVDVVAA